MLNQSINFVVLVRVLSVFLICLLSCIFQHEPTWMALYSLFVNNLFTHSLNCCERGPLCWRYSVVHSYHSNWLNFVDCLLFAGVGNNVVLSLWQHHYQSENCGLGSVQFLVDPTNGHAYATVLRSVCHRLSFVTLCIVAKWCVLEQTLLLTAYRKLYMKKRLVPNEWPWPLFRGHLSLKLPLNKRQGLVNHCITLAIEYLGNRCRLGSRGPLIGNDIWGIEWSRCWWHHVTQKVKLVTPIRLEPNILKTAGYAI